MVPPAPGRLSTTTFCGQLSASFCAMKRAVMSGPPPGVKPTTMRIGLAGYVPVCAAAIVVTRHAAIKIIFFKRSSPHAGASASNMRQSRRIDRPVQPNCFSWSKLAKHKSAAVYCPAVNARPRREYKHSP
jgi:hypothetical protein